MKWIATLADGASGEVGGLTLTIGHYGYPKVVKVNVAEVTDVCPDGAPSRAEMRAALEAAEAYVSEDVDCLNRNGIEHGTEHVVSVLALVRAALGRTPESR